MCKQAKFRWNISHEQNAAVILCGPFQGVCMHLRSGVNCWNNAILYCLWPWEQNNASVQGWVCIFLRLPLASSSTCATLSSTASLPACESRSQSARHCVHVENNFPMGSVPVLIKHQIHPYVATSFATMHCANENLEAPDLPHRPSRYPFRKRLWILDQCFSCVAFEKQQWTM